MDKSIVFDTCMQIRHNYDGCKKGMRPEGGRCVPAKGRLKQEGGGGGKSVNKFGVAAGIAGAGAAAGLTAGIVGGAIDRHRKLKKRQPISGGKNAIEVPYTVVEDPEPTGVGNPQQKLLPAARKRDSAQLVFNALSFVKNDRSDAETRSIASSVCMIIRADGCKKGMRPKGGRCVPAKGRLKQEGGGSSNKGLGAAIGAGVVGAGVLGAAAYGATRHGQRTIGKTEEWAGKQTAKFGEGFNQGLDEGASKTRKSEAYKNTSPETKKQYEKNISTAKGFGDNVTKLGHNMRKGGRVRQAQNRVIV